MLKYEETLTEKYGHWVVLAIICSVPFLGMIGLVIK